MRFNILTLFPEYFASPLSCGLMGKARDSDLVSFELVNPRDFATDKHHTADDRPYGGGPGMVMLCDPLAKAIKSLERPGRIIYLSPRGRPFTQAVARELAEEEAVTLICGRYEGVDERLLELFGVEQISVGDFVLNGGESAACCLIESVARLKPGFMGHVGSGDEESFSGPGGGLLEYPHYTRPEVYEGRTVPETLLSGDHARIAAWRRERALAETLKSRPELLARTVLAPDEVRFLRGQARKRLGRGLYLCLVHWPVLLKEGEVGATSLTNLDVHDMSRVSRSYGLGGFFVATPLEDQRALARSLLDHWLTGQGREANPDRAEALSLVRLVGSLEEAAGEAARETGAPPKIIATSARAPEKVASAEAVRTMLESSAVLLVFGTGHGLAQEVLDAADGTMPPLRFMDRYRHLSVRSAASIVVDRILGDAY